ncbi:response regulator [Saccharospirillum salsuginis]|uniref:DNA-binding response regulator n=1 Tax=Saccharospirillum salsuginis TaxID=418750 RepID=A0A918K2P6_9GAMM|nr:response regulator [Saccharospirillum salsuginis]GGX44344.1 DNA-binding response regulator [Saccharospirillum salsuginis]
MQSEQQKRILVVDDDEDIRDLLKEYLEKNGFAVSSAADGQQMHQLWPAQRFDLMVLDIMMPGDDGFTLCKEVRAKSKVPIIMLTAGSDETDRIIGLELGADDYVGKPFNPRELLARIKAVLRRYEDGGERHALDSAHKIRFGDWHLDLTNRELTDPDGDVQSLNGADFNLLQLFLSRPGEVLSRDDLSHHLRGRDSSPFDRSIDVQISRLRSRLHDDGKSPQLIKTVRGAGYILTVPVVTD